MCKTETCVNACLQQLAAVLLATWLKILSVVQFLRHFAALLLIVIGVCLALFSAAVAFGWGHDTLSAPATAICLAGYAIVFGGYSLLRASDWEPLASTCLKGLLLLGSGLLIPAVMSVAMHFQGEAFLPFGYFSAVGLSSAVGYLWFRKYANRIS